MRSLKHSLITVLLATLMLSAAFALSGCVAGNAVRLPQAPAAEQAAEEPAEAAEPAAEPEAGKPERVPDPGEGEPAPDPEAEQQKPEGGNAPAALSLSKRLCGKYSYHPEGEEGVCYTLNVISFGDNLYALCGEAMEEGEETLSIYSFWAAEFLPFDKADLKSAEGMSARVRVLRFSVMSNFSRYWDGGMIGTVTLTDEGIEFRDFNDEGFLSADGGSRVFIRDERVEEIFPCLNEEGSEIPSELAGLWTLSGSAQRVCLEFEGGDLTIWKKSPDQEVFYARGGCSFDQGSFSGTFSTLDSGGMPFAAEADYQAKDGKLFITFSGEGLPEELQGRTEFVRMEERDIPVVSADEADPDPSVFVSRTKSFSEGPGRRVFRRDLHPAGFYDKMRLGLCF